MGEGLLDVNNYVGLLLVESYVVKIMARSLLELLFICLLHWSIRLVQEIGLKGGVEWG